MRIVVDRMRCEANGICVDMAPEMFRLDDDDELELLETSVPAALLPTVEEAVYRCPKQALSLEA